MEFHFIMLILSINTVENCKINWNEINNSSVALIEKIQKLENCAKPISPFLDKVYSNIKYRANRLKICVGLIRNGNYGFNCNREFRKMKWSHENEECANEFKSVENHFNEFNILFQDARTCKSINRDFK